MCLFKIRTEAPTKAARVCVHFERAQMAIQPALRQAIVLCQVGQQVQELPSGLWQLVGAVCESHERQALRADRRNEAEPGETRRVAERNRRVQHIQGVSHVLVRGQKGVCHGQVRSQPQA